MQSDVPWFVMFKISNLSYACALGVQYIYCFDIFWTEWLQLYKLMEKDSTNVST